MQTPEEIAVPDFETFALKLAVYALVNLDEAQELPEFQRDPDILSLRVKEILIRHLPSEYVRVWDEGSGWTRKQKYTFEKPLPKTLLLQAARDAGFSWQFAWREAG